MERTVAIYTAAEHSKAYPWRPIIHNVDGKEFIEVDSCSPAMNRAADAPRDSTNSQAWIYTLVKLRDEAIDKFIEDVFVVDEDRMRPQSFAKAFLEANVPDALSIVVPIGDGHEPQNFLVKSTTRKNTNPVVELTKANVEAILYAIKNYNADGDGHAHAECEEADGDGNDGWEELSELELGPVKWRRNHGRWSLKVEWRDENGCRHSKWEQPAKGNAREVVRFLQDVYEKNHREDSSHAGKKRK